MTGRVRPVRDADFGDVVLGAGRLVVVALHAQWCAPSRRLLPQLDELARELQRMSFVCLDVDLDPVTAAAYRVAGLPTLLVFDAGELVCSIVGVQPLATIRDLLVAVGPREGQDS